MAKPLLSIFALALVLTAASHAAPTWDRFTLSAADRNLPASIPDNRGGMPPSNPGAQYSGAEPEVRRQQMGRLSPEERRNLRRQINEVGQDIYVPRR